MVDAGKISLSNVPLSSLKARTMPVVTINASSANVSISSLLQVSDVRMSLLGKSRKMSQALIKLSTILIVRHIGPYSSTEGERIDTPKCCHSVA